MHGAEFLKMYQKTPKLLIVQYSFFQRNGFFSLIYLYTSQMLICLLLRKRTQIVLPMVAPAPQAATHPGKSHWTAFLDFCPIA